MKNKTCGECKYFEVDTVSAVCEKKRWICDDDAPACNRFEHKPKMTNGDKIRQMSNEELANLFADACPPKMHKKCRGTLREECFACWSEWIESEVEDER